MLLFEILLILFCISMVLGVFINYIYKRHHHLPTGECCECQKRMEKNLKKIKKELELERNNKA